MTKEKVMLACLRAGGKLESTGCSTLYKVAFNAGKSEVSIEIDSSCMFLTILRENDKFTYVASLDKYDDFSIRIDEKQVSFYLLPMGKEAKDELYNIISL